jgi:glucose/arabinose dehydrogenase
MIGAVRTILALVLLAGVARADGQVLFRQRCAVCHPASGEAGQGPALGGGVGRKAAATGYAYSEALRSSGLTWDDPTLDRFLAAPTAVVPGTLMAIAVPDVNERRELVAFLKTLPKPKAQPAQKHTGAAAGDYISDAPGKRRHITVASLPQPGATPSVSNPPHIVKPPDGARPSVPAGFAVERYAEGLDRPRLVRVAPNGDVFVAESYAGRVRVLRGEPSPRENKVFASGLDKPFGIAFFPPGPSPHWVYVANTNSVVRFPYKDGDLEATGKAETVVARLTERGGGHWTRDIAFSADGKRMFVSIGSMSNVGQDLGAPPDGWISSHGLGAAWGSETDRAAVLVFDADGGGRKLFAAGLRNCVGMAVGPDGTLWCSVNERDGMGDDLVPDYVTRVREGAFYGWPWFWLGDHEDPRHKGARRDLVGKVTVPDVLLQAHSAALQIAFKDGQLFAALHGSWNRAKRTGPKVVRVVLDKKGAPTGEYEDFLTGFVADEGHVWGRPVGVAVARDGSLLVSEDANGTLWRVSRR